MAMIKNIKKGFSLVELLVVVVIIGVISTAAFVGYQSVRNKASNEKILTDLVAVANALEDYKRDHNGQFPIPNPNSAPLSQNVLCFYKDATYAHDCDQAAFIQGMIDNDLLTKQYLREVPTDPYTGSRYVYGVTTDGRYFQVAGIYRDEQGNFEARTAGNLVKGFELPSVIRAYDGPNFVVNKSSNLPYHPEHLTLVGRLQEVTGDVYVNYKNNLTPKAKAGDTVKTGDNVKTEGLNSSVSIYFSDGSVTQLDENTVLDLANLNVEENDKDGTITKIFLKLTTGKIWNKVVRLAKGSEMNIESGGAIAGVRGTEFGIETINSQLANIKVLSGKVEVFDSANPTISIATVDDTDAVNPNNAKRPEVVTFNQLKPSAETELKGNALADIMDKSYKDIPLHSGIEPYLISSKGDPVAKTGTIRVRNVNHLVNEVNALTGRNSQIITNRLAVYDLSQNPAQFIKSTNDITLKNNNPYEIKDLPLGLPLGLKFEWCKTLPKDLNGSVDVNVACTIVEKESSFNRAKITLEENTNLDEQSLNPNLKVTSQPELKLSTDPSVITDNQGDFNLIGDLLNSSEIKQNSVVVTNSNQTPAVCTISQTPTLIKTQFTININVSNVGSCDLKVELENLEGVKMSKSLSIQVIKSSSKITLKRPAKDAKLNVVGQKLKLAWEGPTGSSYTVSLTDPNGLNTGSTTLSQPTYETPTLVKGIYQWEVTINGANDKASSSFEVIADQNDKAGFQLLEGSNVIMKARDTQKEIFLTTIPANKEVSYKIQFVDIKGKPITQLDPDLIYEWGGSNPTIDPVTGKITIDLSQATPGSKLPGKVQLTLRDKVSNTIVADESKNFTVVYQPQFSSITFNSNSITTTPGTTVNIPNLINNLAGIKYSDCQNLRANVGNVDFTKQLYTAPTNPTATTDQVLCDIKVGDIFGGYKVVDPLNSGAQFITAVLTVNIINPINPNLNLVNICSSNKGYYIANDSSCWIMAKANDSCQTACSGLSLKCTDQSSTGTNWDDVGNNICVAINVGSNPSKEGPATPSFNFAPYYHTTLNRCFSRDPNVTFQGVQSLCNVPVSTAAPNGQRICRCEL